MQGTYVDLNGLLALVPLAIKIWDVLTSKEAFKLPENFTSLDTDAKVQYVMSFLQEDRKRDQLTEMGNAAPDAVRVLLGMLGNAGVVQAPIQVGNTQPMTVQTLGSGQSSTFGQRNVGNGGGSGQIIQGAPPPAPAR